MTTDVSKSWYTKYRPVTIGEYCGEAVKAKIQKRYSKRENMPHIVMLYGNRGCGKTTLARILSKYYLCENLTENGPCECCQACQDVNNILIAGESQQVECSGVTELDNTIMNGKDAIQEVLDDALVAPMYSEYKVLILDECHMITPQAQNSMLKIIEDPPPHLVVIFATTNPEKVLQTIKSRCQLKLEITKQNVDDMVDRLVYISQAEGLTVSREALEIIVKHESRVPRECINLLETIAKTYDNQVLVDNVREYLGEVASDTYFDYFTASNRSLCEILKYVRNLRDTNVDINKFAVGLNKFVLEAMYIKHGISLEDYPIDYIKRIKEEFEQYKSSDFDMLVQAVAQLSSLTAKDDASMVESSLILTGMRIGKIGLLSKGLLEERSIGELENRESLTEHGKRIKHDNIAALEKLKSDLDIEDVQQTFNGASVVVDSDSNLIHLDLPAIEMGKPEEEESTPSDSEASSKDLSAMSDSEIDSFFDE